MSGKDRKHYDSNRGSRYGDGSWYDPRYETEATRYNDATRGDGFRSDGPVSRHQPISWRHPDVSYTSQSSNWVRGSSYLSREGNSGNRSASRRQEREQPMESSDGTIESDFLLQTSGRDRKHYESNRGRRYDDGRRYDPYNLNLRYEPEARRYDDATRGDGFRSDGLVSRHQPISWRHPDVSYTSQSPNRVRGSSYLPREGNSGNRSAYHRQERERPMELDENRLDERSGKRRDRSRQPDNQNKQQNQPRRASSEERRAFQKQRGLDFDNHVITKMLQTKPSAAASKQGTSGTPVQLVANYFKILKTPTWQLYLYRVDITPDVSNRKFRNGLLNDQIKEFGSYLFDGSMLYMLVKLNKNVTEFKTEGRTDNKTYVITIKLVGLVSKDTYQYLHVWSILLRKCEASLGLQLVGRNFYDPSQKKVLQDYELELWPGFLTAIHQHETDVLLCVNTSTKVMRLETIYNIMQNYRRPDGTYDERSLQKNVLGMTVRTTYSDRTYKICDFNFDESPETKFSLNKDEEISYFNYFKNKYAAQINDLRQPMLVIKSSQRQIRSGQSQFFQLVPELCLATGFDDDMRTDYKLMTEVAKYSTLNPGERLSRSQGLIDRLQNSARNIQTKTGSRDLFKEWNFEVDTKPIQLKGRQLVDEQLLFGGKETLQSTDWSKFRINEMYVSVHLTNWVLIYPQDKQNSIRQFVGDLRSTAAGMKYNIADPYMYPIWGNSSTAYKNALKKASFRDPQLIFCVLTSSDANTYGTIKHHCIEEVAKPSQAMLLRTYENRDRKTIATKIAIQINCKLGGVPWMVTVHPKGLMTIGFDVFHDKSNNRKSCGAMVATMDMQKKQKFFSVVSDHISGVELSNDLKMLVCHALRQYLAEHGTLPEKILFYRDGVGEGQIPYVKEVEIESILDGLRSAYGDKEVPLTYIVVTKRINTRLFQHIRAGYQNPQQNRFQRPGRGENYQNPHPGTVVDDVITLPERHDFILVSQSVRKGTVSPTNYNILYNNMGLSTDNLQKLTYQMTYLYYNNCATLAVPAVCHYAHRLAFMVGNYDLKPSNDTLQKTLYFL